jgi:hypothetical protein
VKHRFPISVDLSIASVKRHEFDAARLETRRALFNNEPSDRIAPPVGATSSPVDRQLLTERPAGARLFSLLADGTCAKTLPSGVIFASDVVSRVTCETRPTNVRFRFEHWR